MVLRAAIRHPDAVRRLVVVSAPCRRDGWFPDVRTGESVSSAGLEEMRQTPMCEAYAAVAPDADAFPALMDETGELIRGDHDRTDEVRR
ncbi:hypothetical protein [Geodermatophilus sp. SYSU D01119]